MRTSVAVVISACLAASLATAFIALAGPLDPPAGAVASSYKTLAEVEPRTAISLANTPGDADSIFKITQPGSYYLTGNITGASNRHGIEIDASGVTLDLNGFHLIGDPSTFAGVKINNIALIGVAVVNGTVRGWGHSGIDLTTIGTSGYRLERIISCQNGDDGFMTGSFGSISHCSAFSNGGDGFRVGAGSTISHCSSRQNDGDGYNTSSNTTLAHCVASQSTGVGFFIGSGSALTSCIAHDNEGEGFFLASGSSISHSIAQSNSLDGIRASSACLISFNQCQTNGSTISNGANIHVTGGDNRIQDNNCHAADRGIDVDGAGNIILRNTCAGNSIDYDIVANNYYAPIIDRSGVATLAVSGPAAAGTLNTTDPNANFSY